ncbi:MAG: hypothetical protein LC620_04820, partial [Halobacteriales archaeon]|nr:hypothetical protein [Halobacteriales archaeon]
MRSLGSAAIVAFALAALAFSGCFSKASTEGTADPFTAGVQGHGASEGKGATANANFVPGDGRSAGAEPTPDAPSATSSEELPGDPPSERTETTDPSTASETSDATTTSETTSDTT